MLGHPLVPGSGSAIEKGPWHYGADYITVYFKADVDDLRGLVPPPFSIDDGNCMAYVCEIVSVGEGGAAMVSTDPDRTVYREAAVGVRCSHNKSPGVFFPVMWVTTEWSLLRGLVNGYQKRLADSIALTKLHPLNPGLRPLSEGSEHSGFCVKGKDRTLTVDVRVEREGAPADLPKFGSTFGLRRYPSTGPGEREVEEPVEVLKSNSRVADVWLGAGAMETTLPLGKPRPYLGAVYRSGFTISGARALAP